LKIKLIGRHFDTIKVIEVESQVALNTQNATSRTHLKNGRSAGNGAYSRKETTSRVMVAYPKSVFDQMAVSVPEIMYGSL
jgi:hypothetical protein